MERVSMWTAAKKTWLLVRSRFQLFMVYLVPFFVVTWLSGLGPEQAQDYTGIDFLVSIFSFFLNIVLGLSLYHFTVGSCRSLTSFFPENPVKVFIRFIVASLAVSGVSFVFSLIAGLPAIIMVVSGMLDVPEVSPVVYVAFFFAVVLGVSGFVVPMMRFGAMLPAISIGDKYGFSRAWQMTQGHTIRLFLALLLMMVAFFLFFAFFGVVLYFTGSEGSLFGDILISIGTALFTLLGYVFFGVVYQDLNARFEAMTSPTPVMPAGSTENEDVNHGE